MNKNKKAYVSYKIIYLHLVLVLLFSFSCVFTFSSMAIHANVSDNIDNEAITEEKIYYEENIDDDFNNDKVIIVLSKEETNKFKEYTPSDFPEIDCESITDLTNNIIEKIKNKEFVENKSLINLEKFNRILSLELKEKSKKNVLKSIKELEKRKEILSAEPSTFAEVCAIPNDERISEQWGFANSKTYDAWDISSNANQVLVGILDSGIDSTHEDLKNRIYKTETHNITTTLHRDFTNGSDSGLAIVDPIDPNGHGSHVAGIIGAEGNNELGVSGICWNVQLVSLRVADSSGHIETEWVVNAINYATSINIPILNCSFAFTKNSLAFKKAIEAYDGLVVCSAGNSGDDIDSNQIYPASFDCNNIISVGAIDSNNKRSNWNGFTNLWGFLVNQSSNYGDESVDIYAPGTDILSTVPNNKYKKMGGTSMAAPFVTGAAALLLSANSSLSTLELKNELINGADTISIMVPAPGCGGNIQKKVLKLNIDNSIKRIAYKVDSSGEKIIGAWFDIKGDVTIPNIINGVIIKGIGEDVFKDNGNLKSIIIPNTVEYIDSNAFENCIYLQSVTLSNNLYSLGESAFKGCGSLSSIVIPNSVKYIDSSAFENCSNLQNITLSNNLFEIGIMAFKGCDSLGNITIPSSVEYIDDEAFMNCSVLENVTILREISNTTNLGEKAFDGCQSTLKINVPMNRLAEYKNKVYWSSYKNKIVATGNFDEIDLHCLVNNCKNITIDAKYNKLLKLNVECGKNYKFTTDVLTKMCIYNSGMKKEYEGENTLSVYLSPGTYYLDIRFSLDDASGIINIKCELTWHNDGIEVEYNKNTNVLSHLHYISDKLYYNKLYFFNNQGEGFFKFSLKSTINIEYPLGAIVIYDDSSRTSILNRYSVNDLNVSAISNQNENEMYIFLPRNGDYYIDIILPTNNFANLTFSVEGVEVNKFDYTNSLVSTSLNEVFTYQKTQSYVEEVTITHRSSFKLDIITDGIINNNISVYIFEKLVDPGYDIGIIHYYVAPKLIEYITPSNKGPVFNVILDSGTYYIGYSGNINNACINCALIRDVNREVDIDNTLVADPAQNQGFQLGSEVLFNNGKCDDYTITEGFTRNLYLMVENRLLQPMSRLEYDWYSSNENVATVTEYGTVLGHNVKKSTTVTIYAVLKKDPSVVYRKVFTILKDTKTETLEINCNMTYSFIKQNGKYQLKLDCNNCPYPMIQYYGWQLTPIDNIVVSMDHWGRVTSSGTGIVIITGTYTLNPRIKVVITLTITE